MLRFRLHSAWFRSNESLKPDHGNQGQPCPSARNRRAIRAYRKAGFVLVPMTAQEQIDTYGPGDYADTVVMLMERADGRDDPAG